jgi:hypothetical protein
MNRTTHILLQALIGSLHTFVGFPGVELSPIVMAMIHSLLAGLNVTVAALAHGFNTDGSPQHLPFVSEGRAGQTVTAVTETVDQGTAGLGTGDENGKGDGHANKI